MKPRRCDVRQGTSGDGPRCVHKATHRGVDDDGNVFYFCAVCASLFEGGMVEMRELPRGRS